MQENLKKPLADELLFGKLAKGGRVVVDESDGKLSFRVIERKPGGKRGREGKQATDDKPKMPEPVT